MSDLRNEDPRRMPNINTARADGVEANRADQPAARVAVQEDTLMGEAAAARDPVTGAAGTTIPRSTAPAGSAGATGVSPPRRGETRWLVYVILGAIAVILLLLLLT